MGTYREKRAGYNVPIRKSAGLIACIYIVSSSSNISVIQLGFTPFVSQIPAE